MMADKIVWNEGIAALGFNKEDPIPTTFQKVQWTTMTEGRVNVVHLRVPPKWENPPPGATHMLLLAEIPGQGRRTLFAEELPSPVAPGDTISFR